MKKLLSALLHGPMMVFMALIILASCSTSNQVVSDNFIQKRKYRQGFHLNHGHQRQQHLAQVPKSNNTKAEEVSVRIETSTEDKTSLESNAASTDHMRNVLLPGLGSVAFPKKSHSKVMNRLTAAHDKLVANQHEVSTSNNAPLNEENDEETKQKGNIALIAGIAAWVIAIAGSVLGTVVAFTAVATGLASLALAIVAVIYGSQTKGKSVQGTIGFVLGLIYLILTLLLILIVILLIVFFIVAFG